MIHSVVFAALVGLVTAKFNPILHEKSLIMSRSSFIEYFNAQNYSWKMAEFNSEKVVVCAHFDKESMEKLPLQTHDLEAIKLPENFDARDQWPQCETIKEVYDQGNCGSCWTFGTAMTASDRTCIHKDIHVRLSEQDLECSNNRVCDGGNPIEAFNFWKSDGLVTQDCKPYNIQELEKGQCVTQCVNAGINYNQDKHFANKVYKISNDINQIKAEIVKNGPIQAGFAVFSDFYDYKKGIYEHTHGNLVGHHSVRIIGYGVENGINYWLVANSWGPGWGDHGLFKVEINQDGLEFEDLLVAGLPNN